VVADAWQVKEDQALHLEELLPLFVGQRAEVVVVLRVDRRAAEVIVPVGAGFHVHRLPGDHGDRARRRLVIAGGSIEEVLVVVRPRLVVVVEGGQGGVVEQVAQPPGTALQLQPQSVLPGLFPAAAVLLLVFPQRRIAGARLGLDVVPPHVLRALAVGPDVLTRDAARVAPDAFVEMEDHGELRADVQS